MSEYLRIDAREGSSLELYESENGVIVAVAGATGAGAVVLRPDRAKDVVRFLTAYLARLEESGELRGSPACRHPGELSSCTFPACECGLREGWRS